MQFDLNWCSLWDALNFITRGCRVYAIRVLEVRVLILVLKRYIPEIVAIFAALPLNRMRRRVARILPFLLPSYSALHAWISRKWGYLDHLLRMHKNSPAYQARVSSSGFGMWAQAQTTLQRLLGPSIRQR